MTKRIDINGLYSDAKTIQKQIITILFTSDKLGKTLSLCNDDILLTVPFEEIEKLILKTRGEK